jgi:hypothetical protein
MIPNDARYTRKIKSMVGTAKTAFGNKKKMEEKKKKKNTLFTGKRT